MDTGVLAGIVLILVVLVGLLGRPSRPEEGSGRSVWEAGCATVVGLFLLAAALIVAMGN
jgi:hypothetical protein